MSKGFFVSQRSSRDHHPLPRNPKPELHPSRADINKKLTSAWSPAAMRPSNRNRRPYPISDRMIDALMFILGWALVTFPAFLLMW
jgi:hypothetical protein